MNREKSILQTQHPQAESYGDEALAMPADKPEQRAILVEIYVAENCAICDYAYEVADSIRAGFPAVDLRIINLSRSSETIPDAVFATPTYLINGRLWSLGNPSVQDAQERLCLALESKTYLNAGEDE
ncbi:MAG: hypothetical protein DWI57_01170 [Chloroflexi bacterium]|nr:MAG: hypothetical protein DWI57_01170 [Chloroflexota bacterium]